MDKLSEYYSQCMQKQQQELNWQHLRQQNHLVVKKVFDRVVILALCYSAFFERT